MQNYMVKADDGIELSVFEYGPADAETIIFCHGAFASHRYWNSIIPVLSGKYRIITYDQRGHGDSEGRDGTHCTVEQLGKDLSAVIRHTDNSQKKCLIGHSMGGMTIGSWAAQFPEEVPIIAGIILCNTCLYASITGNRIFGFRLANSAVNKFIAKHTLSYIMKIPFAPYLPSIRVNFSAKPSPEMQEEFFNSTGNPSEKAMKSLLISIINMDLRSAVKNFVVPTTVIISDKDNMLHRDLGVSLAQSLEHAGNFRKLVEIRNCGHVSLIEKPREFTSVIISALTDAFSS